MKVEYSDFHGETEWICIGDSIIVDKVCEGLGELLQSSKQEVVKLAANFFNKPINWENHIEILKDLLINLEYKYEQIYISDLLGRYFNAYGHSNFIADRKYFEQVMNGNTVISEPIINRSTGKPIIAIATPILNKNKVIGLFGVTILINRSYRGLRFLPENKPKRYNQGKRNSRNKNSNRNQGSLKYCVNG